MRNNILYYFIFIAYFVLSSCSNESINKQSKLTKHSKVNQSKGVTVRDSCYYFIHLKNLKKTNISEIKQFYNIKDCKRNDSNICFYLLKFSNGLLQTEISFDVLKSDIKQAYLLAYKYHYRRGKNNKFNLYYREGDAYNGPSQQEHLVTYIYSKNILQCEIYREGILTIGYDSDTITTYTCTTNYFYESTNRLNRIVIKKGEDNFVVYYVYNGNKLIGFYPAKEYDEIKKKEDSIYYQSKILEVEKIGFKNFSKKYFSNPVVYNKIIDDCYEPVKNEQLLINGKPIKTFLESIGKKDADHIIFEVADNYFLFYKIIE